MAIIYHFSSLSIQHCSFDFTQQFHLGFSLCQISWGCRCVCKFHAWEYDLLGKCPHLGSGVFCLSVAVNFWDIIWLWRTWVLFSLYFLVWFQSWQWQRCSNLIVFPKWLPLVWWQISWGMRARHPLWCYGFLAQPLWWRSIIYALFVSHFCLIGNCIQLF